MLELARTVRFCLSPSIGPDAATALPRDNTFAGWPGMVGIGVFYELRATCRGPTDRTSGYVADIGDIDTAVRRTGIPIIDAAVRSASPADPAGLLGEVFDAIRGALPASAGELRSLRWQLSPYYSLTMEQPQLTRVRMAQRFEFAAAHRLHRDELSDQENRRVYGRCNNAHGHGHNYVVEVVASRAVAREHGDVELTLPRLESIVNEHVIDAFDHTNLNLDVDAFAGLTPTVEAIVTVCFDRLIGPIEVAGGRLEEVTVWETSKTSCTRRRED